MELQKNLGNSERGIRIAVGVIFLGVGLFGSFATGWRIGLGVAGVALLGTGLVGY